MSRARIGYIIACFGILITTGGCSSSATAPEGASIESSSNRFTNPATADDAAGNPARPDAPVAPSDDAVYTASSGHIAGGGRTDN
ncbi:MAG TPA: hypothetical protein VFY65_11265 [Longimicrobium sp.]|nr:hypothetical protein [Longimicrobium sp.]